MGTRKALTLARAGAAVTVVAPTVTPELAERIAAGDMRWTKATFQNTQVGGALLVVAATDDDNVNDAVVRAAEQAGALNCDASSSQRSHLIFGALLENDGATIAVFTDGHDPARARRKRDELAQLMRRAQ